MDRGLKEGSGLINGLTAGEGKSNGLINGLINGNINGNKITPSRREENGKKEKFLVLWIVLIILVVAIGAIVVSMAMTKAVDWESVKKYKDVDSVNVENNIVNITSFRLIEMDSSFNFYIKFNDDFSHPKYYVSYAYIFIDEDSIPSTGYYTGTLGADYLLKITGRDGKVSGTLCKFSGNSGDVWNWTKIKSLKLTFTQNYEIEGYVDYEFDKNAKFMIVAQNGYDQDITPTIKIDSPALVAVQKPLHNNTIMISLIPIWDEVYVNSIHVYATEGVTLSDFNGHLGLLNKSRTIYVHISPNNVNNRAIEVRISYIDSNSIVTVWGDPFRKFIGVPENIVIDGVFDDWNGLANFYAAPSNNVNNSNIDITAYSLNQDGGVYFYIGVKGVMLKGNIAPELEKLQATGTPGEGNVKIIKRPYDYAKIKFTTSAGDNHTIEIYGYNGKITNILYDGEASDMVLAAVGKNRGFGALEIELKKNLEIISYSIEMTDWSGGKDKVSSMSISLSLITRNTSITVNGKADDWNGTAPSSDNTAVVSKNEFIWKDKIGDVREAPVDISSNRIFDITEFRLTSDGTSLFFLINFTYWPNNILGKTGDPGVMITLDTSPNTGVVEFVMDPQTHINENTGWDYQIVINTASPSVSDGVNIVGDGSTLFTEGSPFDVLATSWTGVSDISTDNDAFVASNSSNLIEGKVSLSEIGNPSSFNVELAVVSADQNGNVLAPNDDLSDTSKIMDCMSIASSTYEEVSDGVVDTYATITLGTDNVGVSNGVIVPEFNTTYILPLVLVIFAIPVALKRRY